MTLPTGPIRELADALPAGRLITDPDVVRSLRADQAVWAPVGTPLAAVRPHTTAEVASVVKVCARHRIPIVTRGAGTGLSGGANAVDGCVVLALEQMTEIRAIDVVERYAVVQPGVVNDHLRAAVAEYGLWYPPDPASSPWSTIGGNVATNAGGVCCVKYGVTGDYVLALEVVTAAGDVVRVGRRTAKGVAGYDLASLIVGSEGTLGIVTEVTVRLRPLPPPSVTAAGFFSSIVDAGAAVRAVAAAGLTPSALELVDRHCLAAVDDWKRMGLTLNGNVLLLARVDDPAPHADAVADQIAELFHDHGATWAQRSTDETEADALFAARRLAYPALERLGPVLTEDVVVPKQFVPDMLARIEELAADHDVTVANIAHAGDGNLHPLIITPAGDDDARRRAQAVFEAILDAALSYGGTVTGEHGVGLLKMSGLAREQSPELLALSRAVKTALDPDSILNPGKVISIT